MSAFAHTRRPRVGRQRRFWLLPLVLAALALHENDLIDRTHRTEAIGLLAVSVLTSLAVGCALGWTVSIWRDEDGMLRTRGTRATAGAWFGMLVLRLGLYGLGSALHIHQSLDSVLLSVAGLLLARGAVLNFRAGAV